MVIRHFVPLLAACNLLFAAPTVAGKPSRGERRVHWRPAAAFNRPYRKNLIGNVRVKPGAHIRDESGKVIGHVRPGTRVHLQRTPAARIGGGKALYQWAHDLRRKGRAAVPSGASRSGFISRSDLVPTRAQRRAIARGQKQAAARDRAFDRQHIREVARFTSTGRTVARNIGVPYLSRRGGQRLSNWTQGGKRLDGTINVPNQRAGGAVALTLRAPKGNERVRSREVFHRVAVRAIRQPVYHLGKKREGATAAPIGRHRIGTATWAFGYVKRPDAHGHVRKHYVWAPQSVRVKSQKPIRLLARAGRRAR